MSREALANDPRPTPELFATALTGVDLEGDPHGALTALVELQHRPTPDVLEHAARLCRSAVVEERRIGVLVLAELKDPDTGAPAFVDESIEILTALAEGETSSDVIAEVARAFGYRGDARGAALLLRWLDYPEQPVRFGVASSLRSCVSSQNRDEVVSGLIHLAADAHGAVRDYALFGLTELAADRPDVRDAILACVRDPDSSTAGQALLGLARLGDPRGLEPLIEFLTTASPGRVSSYGLPAATAYGNPLLLPALRRWSANLADPDDLAAAVSACGGP